MISFTSIFKALENMDHLLTILVYSISLNLGLLILSNKISKRGKK